MTAVALLLVAGLLPACGGDSNPASPGIEPEIINAVDNFQFQTTALENYTGTLRYAWSNTGTMANIDQSCSLSSGDAILTLLDGNGDAVYGSSLTQDGSFASTAGLEGDWTVEVRCLHVWGTMNFRVDKRTP